MSLHTLTIQVPEPLFTLLKERAERANKPVETTIVDALSGAISTPDGLPVSLAEELAGLAHLDDEALWRAARNRLAEELSTRTEELHLKRQRNGLTGVEEQELANLIRQVSESC